MAERHTCSDYCHHYGCDEVLDPDAKPCAGCLSKDEEIARLREALEFYADPDTYFAIGFLPDPPCGDFVKDVSEVDGIQRPGKRARAALAAAPSKGGSKGEGT